MGIRGLLTFLDREGHKSEINVCEKIRSWKQYNQDRSPIIVFDFVSLIHYEANHYDNICGGRQSVIQANFDELLKKIKGTGATLVFFSDLNVHQEKIDEWLIRRDASFDLNVSIYDQIRAGKSLQEVAMNIEQNKNIASSAFGLSLIAQKYGEFHYVIDHECDLELAKFATENHAFAVVTNDSDFIIYDGEWKLWMAKGLGIDKYNSEAINAIQYDRNGIESSCGISAYQRPLFATLLGNSYAKEMNDPIWKFNQRLGPAYNRFRLVAQYVKSKQGSGREIDFKRIALDVFLNNNEKWTSLLRQSVNSYNLNYPDEGPTTEFVERLSKTPYYHDYLLATNDNNGFILSYYDMRGKIGTQMLTELFAIWLRRQSGILKKSDHDEFYSIVILTKLSFDEPYCALNLKPIYPDFYVPPLEEIYFNDEITDAQWDLLAFIMSLTKSVITAIKSVSIEFRLICTTLVALVKGGFCTQDQADGILIAEYMAENNEESVRNASYPDALIENNIRVAHIYNITYSQVRQCFAISGLLSAISAVSCFDGVYFQHVMTIPDAKKTNLLIPCENFRIYRN